MSKTKIYNNANDLGSNPVFQLSLSSKELFHSNFLYWMATDKELGDYFFPNLMKNAFGFDALEKYQHNWRENFLFFREYENFDFCIRERLRDSSGINDNDDDSNNVVGCGNGEADEETYECSLDVPEEQWGRIVFVLENKFKSLPRTDQLIDYSIKACSLSINVKINQIKAEYKKKKFNGQKSSSRFNAKDLPNVCPELVEDYIRWTGCLSNLKNGKTKALDIAPKFTLLSLIEPSFAHANKWYTEKNNGGYLWNLVSYSNYAKAIKNELDCGNIDDFRKSLIQYYYEFISLFSDKETELLNGLEEGTKFCDAFTELNPFKHLRVDDIWQKLVADKIDCLIAERLSRSVRSIEHGDVWDHKYKNGQSFDYCVGDIVHGSGFTRSTGLITYRIMLGGGYSFNIQVQNGQYRRCLEYWGQDMRKKRSYTDAIEETIIKENPSLSFLEKYIRFGNIDVSSPFTFNVSPLPCKKGIPPGKKITGATPEQRGFCKFGYVFIYQYFQIADKDPTIGEVCTAVSNDIIGVYEELKKLNFIGKNPYELI